jgi:F0F1-type ATP synthase membrane subunit b/b'
MNYEAIAVWSQVAGSVLFLVVLGWLWLKFVTPNVLKAQAAENERLAVLERHRDEAKASLDVLRREIEGATHDAGLIRQNAEEQGRHEKEQAIASARDAGERSVRHAQGELERLRMSARDRLRVEFLERALVAARAKASERIDAASNATIVNRFLDGLTAGGESHG